MHTNLKVIFNIYTSFLEIYVEYTVNKILDEFFQYVVNGNKSFAETILKGNPKLLLISKAIADRAGRVIVDATAFQIALGAEDTEMYEMMV